MRKGAHPQRRPSAKAPIRKDILEQIVTDTTLNVFCDTTTVFDLAERIMQRHKDRVADNALLNMLEKERSETQRSIDNIMNAMEQGIVTSSTKSRLVLLESKPEEVEGKIIIERTREKVSMKREDVIKFLRDAIRKSPKQLIRTLVKKVILYDDRIQIYYNYADRKTQKKTERSDGDEADQTFCFYDVDKTFPLTNYKLRSNPHELTLRVSLYI